MGGYRAEVEDYLRQYKYIKGAILEKEQEIAESGIVMRARLTPRSKKITKPTEIKALRLAEIEPSRIIQAIDFVKDRCHDRKADVLQYYFFEGLPYQRVCAVCHMSKSVLFYHAGTIIDDVAEILSYDQQKKPL